MTSHTILVLVYIAFSWLLTLHALEEIASGVIGLKVGPITLTRTRYTLATSGITTVNLGVLALIVLGIPAGYWLGLFTTGLFGVWQGLVHTFGYFRSGRSTHGLGVGFYSSIPLALAGALAFYLLLGAL